MNYNFSGPEEPHKGPTRWEVSVYGQIQEPTQLRGGILRRNHRLLHRRDKEGFHPSLVLSCLTSTAPSVWRPRSRSVATVAMSCFALCALTVKSGELPDVANQTWHWQKVFLMWWNKAVLDIGYCSPFRKRGYAPLACAMIVHDITLPSLIEYYCAIML